MYEVMVYTVNTKHLMDHKSFKFGQWHMIGYWLDDAGYIDDDYEVRVKFVG